MNSDLMPLPEFSNHSAMKEPPTHEEVNTTQDSKTDSSINPNQADSNGNLAHRQEPIPPPSEPMQYRAIGLIRGRYLPSAEQFTQGSLLTIDGAILQAVLLGRIMSLVKNHLELEKDHLWVVYPRTRQENDSLHLQIVGVWEPENLAKKSRQEISEDSEIHASPEEHPEEYTDDLLLSSEIPDGNFSVRGEVVYQSFDAKSLVVKIRQSPRKATDKAKYFKLKMRGVLTTKAVGKFWEFEAKREADVLVVQTGQAIADLPKKRRPPFKGGPRGGRKPFPRRIGEVPKPVKKIPGEPTALAKPKPRTPTPKPIKRQNPPQET